MRKPPRIPSPARRSKNQHRPLRPNPFRGEGGEKGELWDGRLPYLLGFLHRRRRQQQDGRAGGQVGGRAERGREGTLGRAVVNEILVDEPGPARFGFPPGSHFENHLPTEPNYVAGEEFN